jgi:hypothetical protein
MLSLLATPKLLAKAGRSISPKAQNVFLNSH